MIAHSPFLMLSPYVRTRVTAQRMRNGSYLSLHRSADCDHENGEPQLYKLSSEARVYTPDDSDISQHLGAAHRCEVPVA